MLHLSDLCFKVKTKPLIIKGFKNTHDAMPSSYLIYSGLALVSDQAS